MQAELDGRASTEELALLEADRRRWEWVVEDLLDEVEDGLDTVRQRVNGPERMQVLKKQLAMARSFGVECHEISPAEAGDRYPVMRTDDLQGALWLPGDGKANPADLCMSLAKGARNRGARIAPMLARASS